MIDTPDIDVVVERPADMELLEIRNQIMDAMRRGCKFDLIGAGMTMCGEQQADISGTMNGRKISIVIRPI